MDIQLATVTSKEEGNKRIDRLNEKYDFEFEIRPKDSRFQIFAKNVPQDFSVPDTEQMRRVAQDIEARIEEEPKEEAPKITRTTESNYKAAPDTRST